MPLAKGLRLLLGTADLDTFFDQVWEREPGLFPSVFNGTEPLMSRETFEFFLSAPLAGADAGLSIIEGQVARPVVGPEGSPPGLDAVYAAYAAGSTLLQARLQHRSEAIAGLSADIERDLHTLGVPLVEAVSANGYLTPPWAQGFGAHYDNHCALVVQVAGRKVWTVFAPVDDMPIEPCATTYSADELGDPVLEATLDPGDVLYVPRGFPHLAWCRGEDSLHLTFGLRTMTWADAIGALCRVHPRFRRSIGPLAFDEGNAAVKHFDEVLRPAIEKLPMSELLRNGVLHHAGATAAPARGRLGAIAASRRIGHDTRVERVPGVDCVTLEGEDVAVLRFGANVIELHAAMAPVFRFIAAHDEFVIRELPAIDRPYDAVELASILIERGLLQTTTASATPMPNVAHESQTQGLDVDSPATGRRLSSVRVLHRGKPPSAPGLEWVACMERLSAADCDEIIAACGEFPELPPSTVGEERYPDHRQGLMRKLGLTPRTEWIFDVLRGVAAEATSSYFGLELTSIVRAPQYVEYVAGHGHFRVHNDYSHDQATAPRKLTVIMQLSGPADYVGGRLRIFGNEVEDLPDERGTIVAFPSFVFHEVTPVERGVRRALVAWIAGPRLR